MRQTSPLLIGIITQAAPIRLPQRAPSSNQGTGVKFIKIVREIIRPFRKLPRAAQPCSEQELPARAKHLLGQADEPEEPGAIIIEYREILFPVCLYHRVPQEEAERISNAGRAFTTDSGAPSPLWLREGLYTVVRSTRNASRAALLSAP